MTRRNSYPKIWYKLDKGTHKKQDKGKLIFCCASTRGNYIGSVSRQNNNKNSKFQDQHL